MENRIRDFTRTTIVDYKKTRCKIIIIYNSDSEREKPFPEYFNW